MDLVTHRSDEAGVGVLTVAGEVDLATAPRLREQLVRLIAGVKGKAVVVDLAGVTFCDSLGLGVLVGAQRRARALGGRLLVVLPPGPLAEGMSLAGLDQALPRHDTLAAACAAAVSPR